MFEPSKNTITESSQPLPTVYPPSYLATITPIITATSTFLSSTLSPSPVSHSPSTVILSASTLSVNSQTVPDSGLSAALSIPLPPSPPPEIMSAFDYHLLSHAAEGHVPPPPLHSILPPLELCLVLPQHLPPTTSHLQLQAQNKELFQLLKGAEAQMQRDFAQLHLMDYENGKLQNQLFAKTVCKQKDPHVTSEARHMTLAEVLDELALSEWQSGIKKVHAGKKLKALLKNQRAQIDEEIKHQQLVAQQKEHDAKAAEKAVQRVQKAAEKAEKAAVNLWQCEMAALAVGIELLGKADRDKKEHEAKKYKTGSGKAVGRTTVKGKGKQQQVELSSDEEASNASESEIEYADPQLYGE